MAIRTVDLQHAISISVVRASGRLKLNPQFSYQMHLHPDDGRLASERLYLNCDSCLMYERVRTGIHDVRTVASWNISFSMQGRVRTEIHVVRTDDVRSVERPDGMTCRPDRWNSGQMGIWTGWYGRPDG
jgi:hypothetical protein